MDDGFIVHRMLNPALKGLLLLGVSLAGCAVAQARIGETEKQCEARYGTPEVGQDDGRIHRYIKGDMVVFAHFYQGKCDYIGFIKLEESAPGVPKGFSENELDLLLKANGGGKEWKMIENKLGPCYVTSELELTGQYDTSERRFLIITKEAAKRLEDGKKAAEEKKLKGF